VSIHVRDPEDEANIPVKTRVDGSEHVPVHDVETLPTAFTDDVTAIKGFLETLAGAIASAAMKVTLQAGSNAFGKLAANAGVNIGTVDLSAAPLTHLSSMATGLLVPPASGSLSALDATLVCTLYGRRGAAFSMLGGGSFVGTLVAEYAPSAASVWVSTSFLDTATGALSSSLALSSSVPAVVRAVVLPPGGAYQVRIRASAWTSGTATTYVTPSDADHSLLYLAPASPKMDQVGSIGTGADVQFASQVLVKGMAIKNISTAGQLLYLKHSATPTSTNSLALLPGEWSNDIECTNANQVYMRASASGGAACYSGR
jgi:hypothetical protein